MTDSPFKDATLEDIMANPKKYGAPTFQEFCSDPDAFRLNWAAIADNGSTQLSQNQVKQLYRIKGHEVRSIEKADQIAKDHGLDIRRMEIKPFLRPCGGQKYDIIVVFTEKEVAMEMSNG